MKNRLILVGVLFLLVGAFVIAETSESELNNLILELEDSNYSWLINYSVEYPSVEVYEKDSSELIMTFENVSEDKEYKKLFSEVGWNGSNDVFDLRVVCGEGNESFGSGVEFDFVVDPSWVYESNESLVSVSNLRFEGDNTTHLSLNDSSIVLYMPFDSNLSQTTAYDYSDNDNDGTISGATYTNDGVYGGAFEFDNDADIGIPFSESLNFSGNDLITISAWIKPDTNQASTGGTSIVFQTTEIILRFATDNSYAEIILNSFSTNDRVSSTTNSINLDEWNHVLATYNGTSIVIFVNGIEENSVIPTGTYGGSTIDWQIGGSFGSLDYFNGSIDEILIFNRALNPTEISDLYNNQSSRFFSTGVQEFLDQNVSLGVDNKLNWTMADFQTSLDSNFTGRIGGWNEDYGYNVSQVGLSEGLVGYWGLNNNSNFGENDSVVFDYSGNGNNGTPVNEANPTSNGRYAGAFEFDGGSTDYIDIGVINNLYLGNITFSAWLKSNFSTDNQYFFGGVNGGPGVRIDTIGQIGMIRIGQAIIAQSSLGLFEFSGEWQHITVVWYGDNVNGTAYFYRNGVLDSSVFGSSGFDKSDVDISCSNKVGQCMNGSIDEVTIYNRSLSADEIKSLYVKGIANRSYTDSQAIESGENIFQVNDDETNFIAELTYNSATSEFYSPILEGDVQLESFNVRAYDESNNIYRCGVIDKSGVYTLNTSIENYPATCITINVSDVYFDGAGFTIDGLDAGEGIHVLGTSGSELTNVTIINANIADFSDGIGTLFMDNSLIENVTVSSADDNGFQIDDSDNNIFNNITSINQIGSSDTGIQLSGANGNNFTTGVIKDNDEGILIGSNVDNTIITGFNITGNVASGITSGSTGSDNNIIYNNFFNNTVNLISILGSDNFYNTTLTAGTNIKNGIYSGGNYWAFPNGTGYSETCTDSDGNNICDNPMNVTDGTECVGCSGVNIDELPLTSVNGSLRVGECMTIASPGTYILTNSTIVDYPETCIEITSSNVELDCQGYTIDGDDSLLVVGFKIASNAQNVTVKNLFINDFSNGLSFISNNDDSRAYNITINHSRRIGMGVGVGTTRFIGDGINVTNSADTCSGLTYQAFYIRSTNSNYSNMNILDNKCGFVIFYNAIGNRIYDSKFLNNTNYGIYAGADSADDNLIYNNFFNNTLNFNTVVGADNYFNTTLTTEINIIGRVNSGGNYWAYPNGTGYSETCIDVNGNNICDQPMNVSSGLECVGCEGYNIDSHPLVAEDINTWTCTSGVNLFSNSGCWSQGHVPIGGESIVIPAGDYEVNITNNTMPQNLNSFTVNDGFTGTMYFLPLFAEGDWTGNSDGTQLWNVTNNIEIGNGTMKIYGDYLHNATTGVMGNITNEGHGQEWRSVSGDIIVGSGAVLDGIGLGFSEGVGPGYGNNLGASYGGGGGNNKKNLYGNASAPVSLGSGGGSIFPGGSGIKLDAVNFVIIDGSISMTGVGGHNDNYGSGGSIWLKADNISGNGSINAKGGSRTTDSGAQGGGGGRIRLEYGTDISYTGIIELDGGLGTNTDEISRAGTLTFTNNTWPGDWNINGNIGLLGGDYGEGNVINVLGNFNTNGFNVTIYGDCFYNLTSPVTCYNTTSEGSGVWINASGNITVDSESVFDGVGLGFSAGPGFESGRGGTHGGSGGSNSRATYGSEREPLSLGSGNIATTTNMGGSAIKLQTDENIIVNGIINVDGEIAGNSYSPSGGSIWLIAGNISGTGSLNASGGLATTTDSAGGGGRISLTSLNVIEFSGEINNFGGLTSGSLFGSGGTVYINATNSIISPMNIATTGYDGGNITIIDTLLTLSGNYNATGINNDATIILNYTDCGSDFELATFNPTETTQTSCQYGGTNTWICSSANNWTESSCWSLGRVPSPGDDVVFNGGGTGDVNIDNNTMPQNLNSFTVEAGYGSGVIYFYPLFAEGSWESWSGTQFWNVTENIVINSGTMKIYGDAFNGDGTDGIMKNITNEGHGQEWRSLNGNISVGAGAVLDGVGLGFPVLTGPGTSTSSSNGGTHGGRGASSLKNPYGNASAPTSLGSGGYYDAGGSGIKLHAVDLIDIGGVINVSGVNAHRVGAGGSIWLKADNISGSGTIRADGGGTATGVAGGGGRIRLEYGSSMSLIGVISVAKGIATSTGLIGKEGTLTFTNNTWPGNWNLTANIGLLGGDYDEGNVTNVQGDFNTNGYNMTIYGDCFYTSTPTPYVCYNTTSDGRGVWINASGNITITSGSILDGAGLGFPSLVGPGAGGSLSGGSYGGRAGNNPGLIYGNETMPVSLGSGGGSGGGGLDGGSAIKLQTDTGIILLDGKINIVGVDGGYTGSGGSIWLKADNISGSGLLNANAGQDHSVSRGGGGGGRIALTSSSVVEFSGVIDNYGDAWEGNSYDGSGGTVYINAPTITSSGNISVVGYNGTASGGSVDWGQRINITGGLLTLSGIYNASAYNASSGSDGTIALNYTDCQSDFELGTFNPTETIQASCQYGATNSWICSSDNNWTESSCWSLGRVPSPGDDVIFNSGGTGDIYVRNNTMPQNLNSFSVEVGYGSGTIYFYPLFAKGDWTGNSDGTQLWDVVENIVINNGTMKIYGDYLHNATTGVMGNITEDGHGQEWKSVSGNITIGLSVIFDGYGLGFSGGVGPGGGGTGQAGTYGGYASDGSGTRDRYGNASAPTSLGSGASSGAFGGSGIKLHANDLLEFEGIMEMDGGGTYGGSGGSIWLKADNISGSGNLSAASRQGGGDGGGGGRIRLEYGSSMNFNGVISLDESIGRPGTLTFTNNTWPGDWVVNGLIGLAGGDFGDGEVLNVLGDFVLNNSQIIYIYSDCYGWAGSNVSVQCYNTTANGKGVWINASGNILIDAGSRLYGTGLGFMPNVGPGIDGTGVDVEGSSYGGKGGLGVGPTYGNETQPISLGSGGTTYANQGIGGARGGSAIKLEASEIIIVNGIIEVKGTGSSAYGAASGGSIWLKGGNVSGTGSLNATGGNGGHEGGGGGRIALTAQNTIDFSGVINNAGGDDINGPNDGSGGTVYVNATTSITMLGNISTTGYDGGNVTFLDTLLTLSGNINATGTSTNATIKLNYTDCSGSDFSSATFNPTETYATDCEKVVPTIDFVSPTPANSSYINVDSVLINVTTVESQNHSAFLDWNRSLVLWMPFDERNSSGDPTDLSSWSNNGTAMGDSVYTVSGVRGGAMELDGVGDYVKMDKTDSLNFTTGTNFTYSIWIKRDGFSSYKGLISNLDRIGGIDYGLSLSLRDSSEIIIVEIGTGIGTSTSFSNSIAEDTLWHQVTLTYNGTSVVYLDGVAQPTTSTDQIVQNDTSFIIGKWAGWYNNYYFNGTLDEALIFDRVLTPQEINATYNAGTYRLENDYTDLNDGIYTYQAHTIDASGSINSTELRQLTVDTTLPAVSIDHPASSTTYNTSGSGFDINVTYNDVNDFSSCLYSLDGAANVTMTRLNETFFNYTIFGMSNSYHNLTVSCNDSSSNWGSGVASDFFINIDSFISINTVSEANTTNTINVNGMIVGNENQDFFNKLFTIKLNDVLVSSDTLNHSAFSGGVGSGVNISNVVKLNLVNEGSTTTYTDDFTTTKYTEDAESHNYAGYFANDGVVFEGDVMGSDLVGNITYKFSSLTEFFSANVYATTKASSDGGADLSIWYSFDNATYTLLDSTSSQGATIGDVIPVSGNSELYVRLLNVRPNAFSENPLTWFEVNYSSYGYDVIGNFTSPSINLPDVSYTVLKWDQVLNGGTVKMQLRESDDGSSWDSWSSNYTNNLNNDISAFSKDYVQYRAWLETSNESLTPELIDVQILYFNATTNSTGGYNYNITIPTDNIGVLPLEIALSSGQNGFIGSNSTDIVVWAETVLPYSVDKNYTGALANYSVRFNFTRSDLGSLVNGTINVSISNFTGEVASEINESLETGLVLLMHLNNDSAFGENDSLVYDFSGNGNNGSVVGAIPTVDGKLGGAFEFDGDGDYISLGNDSSLKPSLPVTISAWVKINKNNIANAIFGSSRSDSIHYGVWLYIDTNDKIHCSFGDGTGGATSDRRGKTSATSLLIGEWYHVSCVINGATNLSLYLNGIDDNGAYSGTGGALAYSSADALIGRHISSSIFDMNGSIDEVGIWNRSLSSSEILTLYQKGAGTYGNGTTLSKECSGVDNCVASWTVPGDLSYGNYTINVTGDNESGYYRSGSNGYIDYLEEKNTSGSLSLINKTISDFTVGTDYTFYVNATLVNNGRGTMNDVSVYDYVLARAAGIKNVTEITPCSAILPGSTCNATMMVVVYGSANVGVENPHFISWRANWTDNDGTISGGAGFISYSEMYVVIVGNSSMDLSNYSVNMSIQHNNNGNFSFDLESVGSTDVSSVNVTFISSNTTADSDAILASWLAWSPEFTSLIAAGATEEVVVNISVPIQTAPKNYTGTFNVSSSNGGTSYLVLRVEVPSNSSWSYSPSTNLSYNNSYSLNIAGEIGNFTVTNDGNVNLTVNISYSNSRSFDYSAVGTTLFEEDYSVGGVLSNPTLINVTKGENTTIMLYQKGYGSPLSDVGVDFTFHLDSGALVDVNLQEAFTIVEQPPEITNIWFIVDSVYGNIAEQNKNVTIKVRATDDIDLNETGTTFNITWSGGSVLLNGTNLSSVAGEYQKSGNNYLVLNYTVEYMPLSTGVYNVTATVYDDNGGSTTSSAYNFTVYGTTSVDFTQNVTTLDISSIDSSNQYLFNINFSVNNSGNVKAYAPNITFVKNSSILISPSFYTFSDLGSGTNNSKVFEINVTALTPPGEYNISSTLRYRNPDNSYSTSTETLVLNVLSNKSMLFSTSLINLTIPSGASNSSVLEINNTGNDLFEGMSLFCLSGSVCDNMTVTFNESSFSLASNNSISVLINVSTTSGFSAGTHSGIINVSENNISKLLNISVTVPETMTWSVSPTSVNKSRASGQSGELQLVNVTNTGNVDIVLVLDSTNSSIVVPNVSSLMVSMGSASTFMINYSAPDTEGSFFETITLTNSSANPTQINISVNLTVTNLNVTILSPISTNQKVNVTSGDSIEIISNVTLEGVNVIDNSTWTATIGGSTCTNLSSNYSDVNSFWNISCSAPTLTSAQNYSLVLILNHNEYGESSDTSENSVVYRDNVPPYFNISRNHVEIDESINISVNVTDNLAVDGVIIYITYPNATTINRTLSSYNGLYNLSNIVLDVAGEYLVNYTANDTTGNFNSTVDWFEVYDRYNWDEILIDYVGSGVSGANITLYRPNTTTVLVSDLTNSDGEYSLYVNKRFYDLKSTLSGDSLVVKNINFTNSSTFYFNSHRIEVDELSETVSLHKVFDGIASNSTGLGNNSVNAIFNYSGLNYDSASELEMIKCADWDYSGRSCNGTWSVLDSSVDRDTTLVSGNSSGFSAYFLSENKCGNGLCETTYAETTSSCSTDCPTTSFTVIGGGGGGSSGSDGLTSDDLERIEDLIKSFLNVGGVKIETTSIYKELFAGDSTTFRVKLVNTLNSVNTIKLSTTGEISGFITFDSTSIDLDPSEQKEILVMINVPRFSEPGNYDGDLVLTSGEEEATIPVTIRVLSPEGKLLDVKIQPLKERVEPGEILRLQMDLLNLGKTKRVDVQFDLQLINAETGELVTRFEEAFAVETTTSTIKEFKIPDTTPLGNYLIKGVASYSSLEETNQQASSIAHIVVAYPFYKRKILFIPVWGYSIVLLLIASFVGGIYYIRWSQLRKRRFRTKVEFNKLPRAGSRSGFIGKIAESDVRAFVEFDKLQMHTLIAGATGSGKTVAAQDIIEAALLRKKSVIIFDPTAQWTGFLRKSKDKKMLKRYKFFNMKLKEAQGFNGSIKTIRDPYELIDIKKYLNRPGEITIFNVSHLSPKDIDIVVASTIEQIFKSEPEESSSLKALIVYDEVHRLLPKFGGSGEGFIQLERGAREFRKWGIGLFLISQVLSDFVGEVKANIGTELQMGTRYEGDLERVGVKYGDDILKSLVKEPIGTGMMVNAEYNSGRPYFVAFRPLLHNTKRLGKLEIGKYEKYFNELEDLDYQVLKLKKYGVDILDLELELKLSKKKVKEGQFQMAEMYLEPLRIKMQETWSDIGKEPEHFVVEKISKKEVLEGLAIAKKARAKYIKKNPEEETSFNEEISKLKKELEGKKKEGMKTSEVEASINDLSSRLKPFKGKVSSKDAEGIRQEINMIKEGVEKLKK